MDYKKQGMRKSTLSTDIIPTKRKNEVLGIQSLVDLNIATKKANLIEKLMSKRTKTVHIIESKMVQEIHLAKKLM